jgi:LCP family protein required for cell wall assembly
VPAKPLESFASRLVLSFVLVMTLVVGGLVLVNVLVEDKLSSAKRVDLTLAEAPSGGGANYLIIGSDTRTFIKNAGDQQAFGDSADAGGQRSDSIMVLHTDPDSGRALLVSFPRDLWVDVPGRGKSKINAAFNDGPQGVIDTLANNFNVPIHHYVEVNFDSFRQIVDALGTVPVYFPTSARDSLSNLAIPWPGCADLDGPTALAFVRSRHLELLNPNTKKWEAADQIPDLGRIGRQQAFLREIGARAMSEAIANPLTANDIADGVVNNLTVDQDFSRTDVFVLADGLAGGGDGTSGPESQTVPAEPATRDNQSVLEATRENEDLMVRLRDFDTVVPNPSDASPGETKVRVLNASGKTGAAATALTALRKIGFQGGGAADADQPLQTTEIHYAPGSEDEAALVATFVAGPVHVVADDAVSGADVVLQIGSAFEGIVSGIPAPGAVPESLAPVPGDC